MPEQGYDGDDDPLPNVFGDGPFHGADTSVVGCFDALDHEIANFFAELIV